MDTTSAAEIIRELAAAVRQREADERGRLRNGLPIDSPFGAIDSGGAVRVSPYWPYRYLTAHDLATLARADAELPWSKIASDHFSARSRLDALERVFADEVKEPHADLGGRLEEFIDTLERHLREYEFVIPLDNVSVEEGCVVRIGTATLKSLTSEEWRRYCGEVVAAVARTNESEQDKGATTANMLIFESELRPNGKKDDYSENAVLHVRAWGSPESAYQKARDDAHFALAVLKFFSGGRFEERSRQVVALKGENIERRHGWRLRFASGEFWPAMWSDGTGPGLPVRVSAPASWAEPTRRWHEALNVLLTARPKTVAAERVTTATYWLGSALNQPVLVADERFPGGEAKPAGVEVGRRIRDLVTATAALLKKQGSPKQGGDRGDWPAMVRLRGCVEALDKTWCDKHWAEVEAAYEARTSWTHEGVGPIEEAGAIALAQALQAVILHATLDAAHGTLGTEDEIMNWKPTRM
ncbi:MAG: hypothetical protein QOE90_3515 [Thermoplasmata archaeon]|nr:hypothetical protein [Thermoplasmata archaeon]